MPAIKSLNQAVRTELLKLQQLVESNKATEVQRNSYKRIMEMMTPEFSAQLKSGSTKTRTNKL